MAKTDFNKISEELLYTNDNGLENIKKSELKKIFEFNESYKDFLSACKTERECATYFEKKAVENGFVKLENKSSLKAGDKVYVINREKAIMLCVIGKDSLSKGANVVAAHIDSPRLDLKPNPLFEMENIWREDVIKEQDATREQLLALTKHEKDNQIKVPKVL